MNPEHPEAVAAEAGRLFLQRIEEAREEGADVIIESTLSGKSFLRRIERFRESGYLCRITFVTPLEEDVSVERVSLRKRKGGHHVPETDIRRRFRRAHLNFWTSYRFLATDGWSIEYNRTGVGHHEIVLGEGDIFTVRDRAAFERFLELC